MTRRVFTDGSSSEEAPATKQDPWPDASGSSLSLRPCQPPSSSWAPPFKVPFTLDEILCIHFRARSLFKVKMSSDDFSK